MCEPLFFCILGSDFDVFMKKIHEKCIFLSKYLVNSKKSSTFAPAFEKEVRHTTIWCGSSVG